ncbi:hypothetical protein KP509_12G079100 [Ceratopteris richardii]|uniref:Uncharacterized protein n=1 Tax=Ceratopteris richardii TaxID=49495 RepID=A0A8T2TKL6_CERRI|nr:hypothetical protein KP509_12G079100 [Ceratopteris richardii]
MKHGAWYAKIAVGSAICGACMELFMIKTGFYEKVTAIEAEQRAERRSLMNSVEGVPSVSQVTQTENSS